MDFILNLLKNQVFQTIIAGVTVFVLGQIFVEYLLKPLQKYRKLRADAAFHLIYYANRFDATTLIAEDTSDSLRKLAARLHAFSIEKPCIIFWIWKTNLRNASHYLIGLSNSVSTEPRWDQIRNETLAIGKALHLHLKAKMW